MTQIRSIADILNSDPETLLPEDEDIQTQEIKDYQYKYTTTGSIMRKLRSRLKITQGGTNIYNTTNWINTAVDEDLLHEIIIEQEDFLDMFLRMVYGLPLKNKHPILKKCVDGLVISELMLIHSTSGSESSDPNGYGGSMKQNSLQIIRALTYDLNVPIPGLMPEPKDRVHTYTLILEGEGFRNTHARQPLSADTYLMYDFNNEDERKKIQDTYKFDIDKYPYSC